MQYFSSYHYWKDCTYLLKGPYLPALPVPPKQLLKMLATVVIWRKVQGKGKGSPNLDGRWGGE